MLLRRRCLSLVWVLTSLAVVAEWAAACTSGGETTPSSSSSLTSSAASAEGGGGAGEGIALQPFCGTYAGAMCEAAAGCACPPRTPDEPTCLVDNTKKCEATLASRFGGVTLGKLRFDEHVARRCVDDAKALLATCVLPTSRNQPQACTQILQDVATLGESCSVFGSGLLCAEGAGACDKVSGTCVALGHEGDDCTGTFRCAAGLRCDQSVCHTPQPAGGDCQLDIGCDATLVCLGASCEAPLGKGAACSNASQCALGLACVLGTCANAAAEGAGCSNDECGAEGFCVPTEGLRACAPKGQPGETCTMLDDCAPGSFCDMLDTSPTCKPNPTVGEACNLGVCVSGALCDSGTCVMAPQGGEPCLDSVCDVGLACDEATSLCGPGGQPGQPCAGPGSVCELGAVCDYSNKPPTCRTPGGVGTDCGGQDLLCEAGLFCDTTSNQCAPPLALGSPCSLASQCGPSGDCAPGPNGSVCVSLPSAVGATCTTVCGAALRCVGPTGVCGKGACALR